MARTLFRLGLLAVLLCHGIAQSGNEHADNDSPTVGGVDSAATSNQGVRATSARQQTGQSGGRPLVSSRVRQLAGKPISGSFIILYNAGVNVAAAAVSSRAKLVAYSQQQAATAAAAGTTQISPAAAELVFRISSVLESPAPNLSGSAVIQVPTDWTKKQVQAAVQSPDVKSVQHDRWIVLDAIVSPSAANSGSAGHRPALHQQTQRQQSESDVAISGGASIARGRRRRGSVVPPLLPPSPSPTPAPSPPVNCTGQFTNWTACGLNHPPMWQSCMRYRTYVVAVPAQNGGQKCPWRHGRIQWQSCPPAQCGIGPSIRPVPVAKLYGTDEAGWGMARVAAHNTTDNTVPYIQSRLTGVNQDMFVAVVDTGIDVTHPDLVVAGLKDYVDVPGTEFYRRDGFGHGTHVAGIIGAKLNGRGVVGVAPGMPIYAFKVMDFEGKGSMSNVYRSFNDILNMLKAGRRIAAINLSWVLYASSSNPAPADDVAEICGWMKAFADYGVAVVAAAGNQYGVNVQYKLPAMCPDVMAVTALNQFDEPADFSNFAYPGTPQTALNSIMTAPGVDIISTWPAALGVGLYYSLRGTSASAPFVAGGFALCVLADACKMSNVSGEVTAAKTNFPILVNAAKKAPCGEFADMCAPFWAYPEQYYGYMLNVSMFREP